MRRAVWSLAVGGALVSMAACGATPARAPAVTVVAGNKEACEAVGQAYAKSMAPFAEAVTKAAGGTAADRKQAQQKLEAFAASIRAATENSTDAQIRADGVQTADRLKAKAADGKLFTAVKTQQDVSTLLGPTLKEWLSPITHHCS
jgi:hypothetical protein